MALEWAVSSVMVVAFLLLLIYCISIKRKLRNFEKTAISELNVRGIVHDLNNTLTGIIRAAEALREKITQETAKKYAEIILHSCRNFSCLLDDLKSSHSGQREFSLMDISSCLDAAFDLLDCFVSGSVRINKNYLADECLVYGNRAEIENVILNLGLNAVDAMNGSGTIDIFLKKTSLPHSADYAEILIKDYGCGISKSQQEKIFTPLYSDKKCMSGSGLGLYNVKKIVEAHQGMLRLESSAKGTSFFIYLPLAVRTQKEKSSETSFSELKAKILLVDDDKVLAHLTSDMLTKCGADVMTVASAEQAVKVYTVDFDLVLLDVVLPKKSGADVLRELRQINPEVKVLLMSGGGLNEELHAFVAADKGVSFICKPCSMSECCLKISNMLAK